MIESALPVTDFVNCNVDKLTHLADKEHLSRGIYLSSGPDSEPDLRLIDKLSCLCQSRLGAAPDYCLLLDLGHQGRMDALLFSDLALTQPQPLNMLEESDLYPQSSNR